ncbi:MAG: hypothetical protein LKI53_09155, partial [Bacteroidales bacterium]|nr:hypothetical protein [Bacteroidales bacterium]
MKKIAFIVNPISGSVNKENTLAYIKEVFQNRKDFVASAYVTTGPGDAFRTARNFADQKYD